MLVLECSRARALVLSCLSVCECSSARRARLLMLHGCERAPFSRSYTYIYIDVNGAYIFDSRRASAHARKNTLPIVSSVHYNSTVHGYITYEHARKLDCSCHMDVSARLFHGHMYTFTRYILRERCLHFRLKNICSCTKKEIANRQLSTL